MSDRPGHVVGGRYRLVSLLGRGGMAAVWRGTDERLGRPVAVKLLDRAGLTDPVMVARFDREARTAAGLAHPNIVAVHDVGADDGVPYLVMELVDGDSLAARLADGPLPPRAAVDIAGQVCLALRAAHTAGVVHRDIKPANILITPAGVVKVCDFGIARLAHADQPTLTSPDTAIGTSQFMAPEQASGDPVDARTDLYALGCVLYAMLTGQPPFTGDRPLSVLWQHLHQPPAPVAAVRPDIPAELEALIAQLLAKRPADRPADAEQVRDRLAALALPGAAATPVSGATPAPARAGSTAVRATAAVVEPTRSMPALPAHDAAPAPRGPRLGPAGIAAVAGAAAAAAAIVVALLVAQQAPKDRADPHAAAPGSSAPPGPSPTATSSVPSPAAPAEQPADLLRAVRDSIESQARAGALQRKAANELGKKLDEVQRHLARGEPHKAAEKVADLRDKLDDLREDGDIDDAGYTTVLASLDRLAGSLPARARN